MQRNFMPCSPCYHKCESSIFLGPSSHLFHLNISALNNNNGKNKRETKWYELEEEKLCRITYLPIIIPWTPRTHSWKLKSIYTIAGRCHWDYGICVTTEKGIENISLVPKIVWGKDMKGHHLSSRLGFHGFLQEIIWTSKWHTFGQRHSLSLLPFLF